MLVSLALWSGGPAAAQDAGEPAPTGFDAHGLWLAPVDADLRDPLAVPRPGAMVAGDWFLSGVLEYARSPLVQVGADGAVVPVIGDLAALNLSAAVVVHERVRLGLRAPMYGLSTGGADLAVSGPAPGDVRLDGTVLLAAPEHVEGGGGAGLGLLAHLDLPTGSEARFLGQPGFGGGVGLAGTVEFPTSTLTGHVGAQLVPGVEAVNTTNPDSLVAGLAATFRVGPTSSLSVEGIVQPPLSSGPTDGSGSPLFPPAEAILSARVAPPSGPHWAFGAAGGLGEGPGVAAVRAFVGLGHARLTPPLPLDRDAVGQLRTTDGCPLEPETPNGYKDDDGCPDRLGALSIEAVFQGAALAAAGELSGPSGTTPVEVPPQGLQLDAIPGTSWSARLAGGCLEGEGSVVAGEAGGTLRVELKPRLDVPVTVEAVAAEDDQPLADATVRWVSDHPECVPAGLALGDAQGRLTQSVGRGAHRVVVTAPERTVAEEQVVAEPGAERVVRVRLGATKIKVEKEQIRILEKVQFETAKDIIRPESFGLLDEVAAVILANPDLGRVEVAGHTDDRGSDDYNQKLSEARARSVAAYLAGKGVDPARLLPVGYGESRPLDTNKTEEGREVNRRVEFNLLDQQAEPPAPEPGVPAPAAPAPIPNPEGTP